MYLKVHHCAETVLTTETSLVQNLYFPDDLDAEAADPYTIARELTLQELRELRADVQDYQVRRPF